MSEISATDVRSLLIYIKEFRHKAVVMREIHSTLAEKCRKRDFYFTIATLALVSGSTFIGFSGTEALDTILKGVPVLKHLPATFSFNFLVFLIFFTSLLNLIFRWKENHTLYFQGVVRLTHFILWLDEVAILTKSFHEQTIKDILNKYQAIIDILPPNDNDDYIYAKKSLIKKATIKSISAPKACRFFQIISNIITKSNTSNNLKGQRFFIELINSSPLIMAVLKCTRDTDEKLWLGGGAIRNYVWDTITGRTTNLDDLDIVYYDQNDLSEVTDQKIESNLVERSEVNLHWSVKNQARMYSRPNEPKIASLEEAIFNWPETATAIIIRLDKCGNLIVIAPHGLDDLFSLIVRPTPFHRSHPESFQRRLIDKDWLKCWPELKIEAT